MSSHNNNYIDLISTFQIKILGILRRYFSPSIIPIYFPKLNRILIVMIICLIPFLFITVPLLIPFFYGAEFSSVIPIFRILLFGSSLLIIIGNCNSLFTQTGHPLVKSFVRASGFIVNIGLLIFLFPQLELIGSALALSISYIIMFIVIIILVNKYFEISYTDLLIVKRSDFVYLKDMIKRLIREKFLLTRS